MNFNIIKKIKSDLPQDVINIYLEFNNKTERIVEFIEYIKKYNNKVLVQKDLIIKEILYDDIIFFFSKDKYNYCQTQQDTYKIKSRLYEIEKLNTNFMRISKNCIVNLNHIKNFDISKTGKIQLNLDNGMSQIVSRRKVKDVLDFFDERII